MTAYIVYVGIENNIYNEKFPSGKKGWEVFTDYNC
jgi:hypothetical protein